MFYLNNAATSYPKPSCVSEAVRSCLDAPPVSPHRENGETPGPMEHCRENLAVLFGVHQKRIVLCSGATEALCMAIFGTIGESGHVVTTTAEHNSVLRPLHLLQKRHGVTVDFISAAAPFDEFIAALDSVVRDDTNLVIINHVSNVTGTVAPVSAIYEYLAGRNIPFLIDGSQSAGNIALPLQDMPLAMFAFTGHKSLLGPQGTGGLVLGESTLPKLWKVGGTGIHSTDRDMPDVLPLRYEAGTPNQPGFAGLAAAVAYLSSEEHAQQKRNKQRLFERLYHRLTAIPEITVYSPAPENNPSALISFRLVGWNPEDLGYLLHESFDIRVRTGLHCAPMIHQEIGTAPEGTVRVSLSVFSEEREIDALGTALESIAGGSR